ncbi:MAG: hypothetical protein RL367_2881 [Pseudomonadota bacterium]
MGNNVRVAKRICGALLTVAGAMIWAGTANAASRVATGKVVIVRPNVFINVQDLDFGAIIPSAAAGTVTIPPFGARTSTGGITVVPTSLFTPARFAGEGTSGQLVAISVTATSINLTRVGGTQTMAVDTFVIGSTPTMVLGTAPTLFTIGSSTGIFNFPVGATLRVNANQVEGSYVGNFTVTLNYQ